MGGEDGQATIEWVGLVLVAALGLGALAAVAPLADGRSLGGFLAHRLACAAGARCEDGDAQLRRAYGAREAELLRSHAPNLVFEPGERQLPVDFRRCRARRCADAPDDRDADLHRSSAGERATAFTRVVRRGRRTYLQYWLYYPDSNTTLLGSDRLWAASPAAQLAGLALTGSSAYPGFHRDDWEAYVVRLDQDDEAEARASSHGHWQSCKWRACRDRWGRATGWTRVSRGSHAGHVPLARRPGRGDGSPSLRPSLPGVHLRERTASAEALRLVPLEGIDRGSYRPLDRDVKPPWRKPPYHAPDSDAA